MKEEAFEKRAKTINKGKVKYKTKDENKDHKTETETKETTFTNTKRADVKMIIVDNTSKYDHSGY